MATKLTKKKKSPSPFPMGSIPGDPNHDTSPKTSRKKGRKASEPSRMDELVKEICALSDKDRTLLGKRIESEGGNDKAFDLVFGLTHDIAFCSFCGCRRNGNIKLASISDSTAFACDACIEILSSVIWEE